MLSDIFTKLDEWRHLPAYQLERRVDVFFGLFLPEIIAKLCVREHGLDAPGDDITVVPEFPLHKGRLGISDNNQSLNVDFAVFCSKPKRKQIFLVELKTDPKSIKKRQLKNMVKARCAGPRDVFRGVLEAANASKEWRKYVHLMWKLCQIHCIGGFEQIDMKHGSRPGLPTFFEGLSVSKGWHDANIELVLICLKKVDKPCVPPSEFYCMYFHEIAAILKESRLPFASEFAGYLCEWAKQDAGYMEPWVEPATE